MQTPFSVTGLPIVVGLQGLRVQRLDSNYFFVSKGAKATLLDKIIIFFARCCRCCRLNCTLFKNGNRPFDP